MSDEHREGAGPSRLEDLQPGMILTGKVVKIAKFGAFVDLGVGHDGLIHISELSNDYVQRVEDAVQVGDQVEVKVLEVDPRRRRISLSMKDLETQAPAVEEDDEPLPTIMELAFRRAFGQPDQEKKPKSRRKKKPREQNDIMTRTLQLRREAER